MGVKTTWNEIWLKLLMLAITYLYIEGSSTLSTNRRPVQSLELQFICTDSGQITQNVNFYKGGNIQGGCIPDCGSGITGYEVSQNRSIRVTYLTITSVDEIRDAGSWICKQAGSVDSNTVDIQSNLPTSLTEGDVTTDPTEGSTISPPQDIVVSVNCANPVPNTTWSYTKDGVKTSISSNDESDPTGCPAGKNKLTSSLNTSSIAGTGMITLTVKVEHDSFNPANNYARLFTFEVNLGATTISPTPPEPTTATPTSTATTTSTEITKPVCENVIICIIVGCIGGVAVVTVIFICCCCCPCCLPSCFPSKCPCCCRGACKKRKTSSVKGGTNGQRRTSSAEGKEQVPIDDYPTSEKTGGDYLKKRNGGVDSEDILIKIPDGQSDGMRDDRVPKPDGRSEGWMQRL